MNELLESLLEESVVDDKYDFFIKRTTEHIDRVKKAAQSIVTEYPEFEELLDQVEDHDVSKFEEPEEAPYIELTWKKKHENNGEEYDEGPELKKQINQATLYHIKNNRHHQSTILKINLKQI